MTDAFIYDHVRTPRGTRQGRRRRCTRSPRCELARQALVGDQGAQQTRHHAGRRRRARLRRSGGRSRRRHRARRGAHRRLRHEVPGHPDQPLLRLGPRGRELRRGASHVRRERHDHRRRRRVACRRVGIGASGGAWPIDPAIAIKSYFMPQGISADLIATKYGFSRDDVDAYAVESQKRAAKAWEEGRFKKSVVPSTRRERPHHPRPATSTCGPRPTCSRWRS